MSNEDNSNSWGRILVTGGGGFLGSHLVEAFAALPEVDQVIMTGRNPNKERHIISGAKFELCDISDEEQTKALIAEIKPTMILHTMHTISPGPFVTKTIAKQDSIVRALIYTSSIEACSSVLGNLDHAITEEEVPVNDLDSNDYWYCRTKGAEDTMSGYLLTSCVRTPGLYGPRDDLITTAMLSQVNTSGAHLQFGPDNVVHEWLYIDNAVLGHTLTARKLLGDHRGVSGEAFFLTDGMPMKFYTFARTIFKEAGDRNMNSPNPKFTIIPFWVLFSLLALWEYIYRAATLGQKWPFVSRQNFLYIRKFIRISIEKAEIKLGYVPIVGTEEGIRRTVSWFEKHKA